MTGLGLQAGKRKLFVPYVTAGLPSPQSFVSLVGSLSQFADAIEVGIPFSDPVMDGAVIQEASQRALTDGVSVARALSLIKEAVRHSGASVVVMSYLNPLYRFGLAAFVKGAADAGVKGLIVPDLPFDDSDELNKLTSQSGVDLVQMIAPTTPATRATLIARNSKGFVYAVSRLGVTGERDSAQDVATHFVSRLKETTDIPVLAGIGVSTATQAAEICEFADGVIIGAAIMRRVLQDDLEGVFSFASEVRGAIGK